MVGYNVVMIVEWAVTLSNFDFSNSKCGDIEGNNVKFIILHSFSIAIGIWGLFFLIGKSGCGIGFFIGFLVANAIWRMVLYSEFFNFSKDTVESCYFYQRFNTNASTLHFIELIELSLDVIMLIFGW